MIKNELVQLDRLTAADYELVTKWNFDKVVTEFFTERVLVDDEKQQVWFNNQLTDNTKQKFIITCLHTQQKIGMISLMKLDHQNHQCEIGITIGNTNYWGKPHAAEAMKMLLNYSFAQLNMQLVYLTVFENNLRAINFFHKIGFKNDGILRDAVLKGNNSISLIRMTITEIEYNSAV